MANVIFSRDPVAVPKISTNNRKINTAIPAPGTSEILKRFEEVESRSMHGQLPIVWERANGHSVFDIAGNQWIDFTSTIFVANTGHSNPHVFDRIQKQLGEGLLHSYAYVSKIRLEYLEKLIKFSGKPFEKAFLLSAGTEATEAALKLMRLNAKVTNKRKPGVICIEGNWHGRTMGAQMMGWKPQQKEWIGFLDPNIYHIPFPYPWKLEGLSGKEFFDRGIEELVQKGVDLDKDICGMMLETFQGWGAVFYPTDFVQAARDFCTKRGALLAFDEMQAGFGRTGEKFGFQHYGVEPDLICVGKGMGSGFPISGVIGRSSVMDLPEVGDMSSTHSANPIVCAAGLATIEEIESKNLVSEAARKGAILHNELNTVLKLFPKELTYVLGKGMIAALLFQRPEIASRVSERCMQKGVLVVHTGRESIKLGPPITITDEALREGIAVLRESIAEIIKEVS